MMKNFLILFVVLSAFACSDDAIEKRPLTFENFNETLKSDMDYADIVGFFGEPAEDIGSGIHIYVYQLSDSTKILIGYTDQLLFARHVDQNDQLLYTII